MYGQDFQEQARELSTLYRGRMTSVYPYRYNGTVYWNTHRFSRGDLLYNGKIYKGATFYNKQRNILESHILDFNEDIYDKEIEVCLIEKVRDEMKFKSKEDAENQFKKDIQNVKKFFKIKN